MTMTMTNHETMAALDNARIAFDNLVTVVRNALTSLHQKEQECEELRSHNQALQNANAVLQADMTQTRDRSWTAEAERDNFKQITLSAERDRDNALAALSLAQDEIRKLRDVILNVAVAIDNEVKTDPKPAEVYPRPVGATHIPMADPVDVRSPDRHIPAADPSWPTPGASPSSLAEAQERDFDQFQPVHA